MPRPKTRQLPVQSPDSVPMIRRITPFDDPVARTEAGVMGMLVFIVSLITVLLIYTYIEWSEAQAFNKSSTSKCKSFSKMRFKCNASYTTIRYA